MKKYKIIASKVFVLLFVFTSVNILSQNQTKELNVDRFKVLLKNSNKDVISIRLFVKGGTANYPAEKQGIEALTYNLAIKGGTVLRAKTEFLSAAEKMGTSFGSDAALDYGEMYMTCLRQSWDDSWKMFAEAVMTPEFSADEFSLEKEQYTASAKQNESDPDYKLQRLALGNAFSGKNYSKDPNGTAESFTAMTLEDIKAYYRDAICKQKAFLVVVGNVNEADITEKVRQSLGKLPDGIPPKTETVKIDEGGEQIIARNIATNYISGIMSSEDWSSPDAAAMMVAMNIMYEKFFVELRTKRSLSYAPGAFLNGDAISSPYVQIYISTIFPKESIDAMVDIINNVLKNGFTEEELRNAKNSLITSYFMRNESASGLSFNIGRWNLRSNLKMNDGLNEQINAVSVQDINKVFSTNAGKLKWTYLGDPAKVSPEDFKQIEKLSW